MTDAGLCCFSVFFLGFMATMFWLIFRESLKEVIEGGGHPGCACPKCNQNELNDERFNEFGAVGTCPEHEKPLKYCKECVKHMKEDWRERL